jgi:MFS family permease
VLSDIGSQVTVTAMPLLVLFLTGSAADAGLVGVAGTIAYPVAALPSGVLADRMDRRRLMMASALLRLVAIGSVPVAFAFGRPSLVQLVVVALVNATLFSTSSVAERGLIGEIVAAEAYPEAVTLNEARSAVALTAGPPLGACSSASAAVCRSSPTRPRFSQCSSPCWHCACPAAALRPLAPVAR